MKKRNAFAGSARQVIGLLAESTERLNKFQIAKKPHGAASCLGYGQENHSCKVFSHDYPWPYGGAY